MQRPHGPYILLWPVRLWNIFAHYLINSMIFKNIYLTWNECFDFLFNFFPTHFSLLEELSEIWWNMYFSLHEKYPLFLFDFDETWIFSIAFRKILKYQILWKSIHWEPSCSTKDRRKIIVAFGNFANAPNKGRHTVNTWEEEVKVWRKRLVSYIASLGDS